MEKNGEITKRTTDSLQHCLLYRLVRQLLLHIISSNSRYMLAKTVNFSLLRAHRGKAEGMSKQSPVPGIAESVGDIKRRYEDTSQVLFQERREKLPQRPSSFLAYGDTKKCYAYSGSGKPYIEVSNGVRADQQSFQSQICSIM